MRRLALLLCLPLIGGAYLPHADVHATLTACEYSLPLHGVDMDMGAAVSHIVAASHVVAVSP